jgi:hypothetical protein
MDIGRTYMRSHACETTHNVLAVITVYWTISYFRDTVAHAGQGIQAMHMVPFDTVPMPLHGAVAYTGKPVSAQLSEY